MMALATVIIVIFIEGMMTMMKMVVVMMALKT